MNQKLSSVIKGIQTAAMKHSPEILTGIGIAGMITTTVLAVSATPKALKLIEARKAEQKKEKLTPVETMKTTWKCYIAAAVTCASSIACIVGASTTSAKRNAAIATAYSISEAALREYRDKVVEVVGEKKEQAVRDAVAKDKLEKNPAANNEIIVTEKGEQLCYDSISGRYFKSDIDKIKKAENVLNHQMITQMYASLNDFYYELGLEDISIGDELGWNVDTGCLDIGFSSQLTPDGTPCLVMDYKVAPIYNYAYI